MDWQAKYDDAIRAPLQEIERLRELLRHADMVVIWEGTSARAGFQEEIEAALRIGSAAAPR